MHIRSRRPLPARVGEPGALMSVSALRALPDNDDDDDDYDDDDDDDDDGDDGDDDDDDDADNDGDDEYDDDDDDDDDDDESMVQQSLGLSAQGTGSPWAGTGRRHTMKKIDISTFKETHASRKQQ